VIVGHGVVVRQVLGPMAPSVAPAKALVMLRRYRCRGCRAIIVVGPRGLVARRWYGGGAIAFALAAYARGETSASARACTSPSRVVGGSSTDRWVTLARWIEAARRGEIFAVAGLRELGRRCVAEHVVLALAGRAGWTLGADLADSAFLGASIAA
jgi:hypothetical protein